MSKALCVEIEHFVTGVRPAAPEPGVVRAILHCDIEGSTPLARRLGNSRWGDLLAAYGGLPTSPLAATAAGWSIARVMG